ncbi:hypothetical protein BJX76DRAFT_349883 [Aspergillus varians]
MADKQNPVQNPIACEPCRQKKCKCSDPVRCIYPESGKRGLPQGYITHLENRLAATERALYSSYNYSRTISSRLLSIPGSPQPNPSRTTAINEWSRLPLRTPSDLENWWAEKARVYGTAEGEPPSEWILGTTGMIPRDRDVPAPTGLDGLSHGHIQARPSAGYPREGQAERLAELEPAVYF